MGAPLAERLASLPKPPTSDDVLSAFLAQQHEQGLTLYAAQEEALLELAADHHVILGTPTGSGKSLVAQFGHFLACARGRRSVYTCPIKALVSEKFFALCEAFGAASVGMLTGDASINPQAPILCCTAEVLANMALRQPLQHEPLLVIQDEFHYFAEPERGRAWELPLLTLGRAQFLLMSATLGDVTPIRALIAAQTGTDVAHIAHAQRPVPLDFHYSEVPITETLEQLLQNGGAPVYVVHFSQREAIEAAQAVMSINFLDKQAKRAIADELRGFRFDTPFGAVVQRTLLHGVGIHHAGLLPKYRMLTERLAQMGHLRVLMGTDTLGVGVNVPIRTVLFTRLCKFDGTSTRLLAVRDFLQIAGRAGRRGFDTAGSVIVQAPEHVIENRRMQSRAEGDPKKLRKLSKKKPPQKGFVPWDASSFERLRTSPPEPLRSQFRLDYQLILACMRNEEAGFGQLVALISRSLLRPGQKALLRREGKKMFQTLVLAQVLERNVQADGRRVYTLVKTLGDDFSLTHTLGLFVLDVLPALCARLEHTALDTLSLIESIIESPAVILNRQVELKKREKLAELKAQGVPYEERIEQLDALTYDKPLGELFYDAFDAWREHHPAGRDVPLRPKSIARAMVERYASFNDYVRELGLERAEGVLLRYLGQVLEALASTLPPTAIDEPLGDIIAYLEACVAQVDTSLTTAWEALVQPATATAGAPQAPPSPLALLRGQPKLVRARMRQRVFALCQRLAAHDFEQACAMLTDPDDAQAPQEHIAVPRWTPEALAAAISDFESQIGPIDVRPQARLAQWVVQQDEGGGWLRVVQTLLSEHEPTDWAIDVRVHLDQLVGGQDPQLYLSALGPMRA